MKQVLKHLNILIPVYLVMTCFMNTAQAQQCSSLLALNSNPKAQINYDSPKDELLAAENLSESDKRRIQTWLYTDPDSRAFLEQHLQVASRHINYAEETSQMVATEFLGTAKSPQEMLEHVKFMTNYTRQSRKRVFDLAALQINLLSHFMFDPSIHDWTVNWFSAQALYLAIYTNQKSEHRHLKITEVFMHLINHAKRSDINSLKELFNNSEAVKPLKDLILEMNSEGFYLLNENALTPE